MRRLEGRVALITGAGSGIGRATARRFAEEGAIVYVTDVDGAKAEIAVADIQSAGGTAHALAVDVSRGQDVTAMFQQVATAHGQLDVLVNNAGLNIRGDFRHMSDADWVKIREVNLDGMVRVARDGFALLQASRRGSLINVASIMANRALRQLAAYSATKGAIVALTRGLAVEYGAWGIRVNALCPGFVETPLTARILNNAGISKALLESTPLRRFGRPEDIANAALFLASDEAAYVTGTELAVDGGMAAAL
jgi:NAD(P)-dependent dehydrogenase (short-subunit alcohol dehydrogenase family)